MKPVARENQKKFLIAIAKRYRTTRKMARIGVALKLFMTLILGYIDVLTDLLVAKSYYGVEEIGTTYATAGFAVLAIVLQALGTFFQYAKKSWRERFGHTLLALLGLAPLIEGANLWTGKEDDDLLVTGAIAYAIIKAIEICFESIPESIIQMGGLLNQNYGYIKMIQIVGVISSIVFGMFLFNACYFSQFVFAMSLFAIAFGSKAPVFILLGVELCAVCTYMGWKGELYGFALLSKPSKLYSYVFPFLFWAWYHVLVSAAPMLFTAAPNHLGLELFAGTIVWRLLTNGGITYLAFGGLGEKHYLSLGTGMARGMGSAWGWQWSGWVFSSLIAIRYLIGVYFGR
ncbi:hypothetical protein TL16_g10372 [Triparma laevis f. inornata]|uniref:Uncharacterized protein n=1 Tax=Triparma laevis f. inornata TaxID=1714386 RepID=A0A9W7B7Y5_9STRA|nr:hypothetical protein TL16_g10372 [Triparma laevis f. inornata]